MRSYNSLKSRITNASVKQTNVLSNFLQTQGLGNTVPVSGNVDLTGYALKTYVDSSINTVYATFASGTTSYSKAYIDASFNAVYTKTNIDASFNSVYTKTNIDASFNAVYTKTNIDSSFYNKSYIDASFNSVIAQNTTQNILINGNAQLGSGNKSVAINKAFSTNYALDVSGATNLSGALYTLSDVSINGKLFASSDVSINTNLVVGQDITAKRSLFVTNRALFSSDVSINGFTKHNNSVSINKDISSNFALDVSGVTNLRGALYALSDVSVNGKLFASSDASINTNLVVGQDVTANRSLFVTNRALFSSDVSINGFTKHNNSVSINKDISSNFALDVSGVTNLRGALYTLSDVSVNGKLFASGDVSVNTNFFVGQDVSLNRFLYVNNNALFNGDLSTNQNLYVSKRVTMGRPPTSTAYELDVSGQMRIYEAVGSNVRSSSSVATLTLEHGDASGCSSILFKSPSTTTNSDFAYIKYQDLSGATSNAGLLTIGVEKDPTVSTTADKIALYAAGGSGFVGVNLLNPAFNLDVSGNTNISNTLTTNTVNTTTTTSNLSLGATIAGTLSTNGVINIGQNGATASAGNINIGIGTSQTGAINIGSGASTKNITIGSTTGGVTTIRGNDISLNGGLSGALDVFSTSTTGGSITIGAPSGAQTLTVQRPIRLVAGSDPSNVSVAIGYIMPNVSLTQAPVAVPASAYTWSSGLMTLGVGVWMVSLYVEMVTAATVTSYNYNMGLMTTAPTTGAGGSRAPGSTLSGLNSNQRSDDNTTLSNGTYAYQIGGVILNNYSGTYNSLYGIFNAVWTTSGTIEIRFLTLRAVRIA